VNDRSVASTPEVKGTMTVPQKSTPLTQAKSGTLMPDVKQSIHRPLLDASASSQPFSDTSKAAFDPTTAQNATHSVTSSEPVKQRPSESSELIVSFGNEDSNLAGKNAKTPAVLNKVSNLFNDVRASLVTSGSNGDVVERDLKESEVSKWVRVYPSNLVKHGIQLPDKRIDDWFCLH
jgi:hypothetical protein